MVIRFSKYVSAALFGYHSRTVQFGNWTVGLETKSLCYKVAKGVQSLGDHSGLPPALSTCSIPDSLLTTPTCPP